MKFTSVWENSSSWQLAQVSSLLSVPSWTPSAAQLFRCHRCSQQHLERHETPETGTAVGPCSQIPDPQKCEQENRLLKWVKSALQCAAVVSWHVKPKSLSSSLDSQHAVCREELWPTMVAHMWGAAAETSCFSTRASWSRSPSLPSLYLPKTKFFF